MDGSKYEITEDDGKRLGRDFTYHKPFGDQSDRYESLRQSARNFAGDIIGSTPKSREQSLALTKLEEACFWANAAIARNEKPPT